MIVKTMAVSLDRDIAIDLISSKVSMIKEAMAEILQTWNEDDTDEFLEKAKTGKLEEAEMDAITIRQLRYDLEKYQSLLEQVQQ